MLQHEPRGDLQAVAEPAGDGERQDGGDALRRDGGAGTRVRRGTEEVQQVAHKAQTGGTKIMFSGWLFQTINNPKNQIQFPFSGVDTVPDDDTQVQIEAALQHPLHGQGTVDQQIHYL